jgi:hypothetical protein
MNEAPKKVKVPAEDMERILNKMDHWRRRGVPEAEVQQYFKDCVSRHYRLIQMEKNK